MGVLNRPRGEARGRDSRGDDRKTQVETVIPTQGESATSVAPLQNLKLRVTPPPALKTS
jgi:hypothetical protein